MRKSKRKNTFRPRRIFLKVLSTLIVTPILLAILCYGFARYGGEIASSNVIPIYPNNIESDSLYFSSFGYNAKYEIFSSESTAEDIRQWYSDNGISLSPFPTVLYRNNGTELYEDSIEYDGYFGTSPFFDTTNSLQQLHSFSALMFGGFDEMVRSCQSVRVYFDNDLFRQDFPDMDADLSKTLFVVSTCWLRVD